jgi:hypothetical protein
MGFDFGPRHRLSESKLSDFNQWKGFSEEVNEVYNSIAPRLGFYIEFLEFISYSYKKDSLEAS